jgi:hypothetical protein
MLIKSHFEVIIIIAEEMWGGGTPKSSVAESSKRIHEDSDGEDIRAVKRKSIRRK